MDRIERATTTSDRSRDHRGLPIEDHPRAETGEPRCKPPSGVDTSTQGTINDYWGRGVYDSTFIPW
jgi:hypothetical protein